MHSSRMAGRASALFAALLVSVSLLAPTAPAHAAAPASKPAVKKVIKIPAPDVRSNSVLVMDRNDGTVIYSRKADLVTPIASITKLMTALVVLDGQQPLDEIIEINTDDHRRTQGSGSRLAVGTKLSRADLMRLALMSSENRAAQALGRSYTGGLPAFVKAMND